MNCCVAKRRFAAHAAVEHRTRRVEGHGQAVLGSPMRRTITLKAATSCGQRLGLYAPGLRWRRRWRWPPWALACTFLALAAAPEPVAQNGGGNGGSSSSQAIARCSIFMPLTPSISEWRIFTKMAKRLLPPSPSLMMVHSRAGAPGPAACSAAGPPVRPAPRSPPGHGSAAWRTWYSLEVDVVLHPGWHRVLQHRHLQALVPRRREVPMRAEVSIMRRR